MATLLGSLLVSLGLESGEFKSGLTDAEKQLKRTTKNIESAGQRMADAGQKMTLAVSAPLALLAKRSVEGFVEQQKAMADVNAALASMGKASGRTAKELNKAADAMELNSLYDAEVILKQVTANLLTFGNVAGKQFDRAQQAAIDMATRLGGEPQAAAIMLGKALNDPVKGITALTRVGVQFTEKQKATIKALTETGDVAGAQGVILAEVERQFKGAAAAAADATPWRQAQVAIGQAMDTIGAALLPIIKPVAEGIASIARAFGALPEPMQKAVVVAGALAAALGPILMVVGPLVTAMAPFIATLKGIAAAQGGLMAVRAGIVGIATAFGPMIAVAGAAYLVWQNWDDIAPRLQPLIDQLTAIGVGLGIVEEKSVSSSDALKKNDGYRQFGEDLLKLNADIQSTFDSVEGASIRFGQNFRAWLVSIWQAFEGWTQRMNAIGRQLKAWLSETADSMISVGRNIISGLVRGIRAAPGAVRDALFSVVNSGVKSVKDFLGIESPSRLFMEIGEFITKGLAIGIGNGNEAEQAMIGVLDGILQKAFPTVYALRELNDEIAALNKGAASGLISGDLAAAARQKLTKDYLDGTVGGAGVITADNDNPIIPPEVLRQQGEKVSAELDKFGQRTQVQTVRVEKSFKDMAQGILGSLQGLVNGIKGGGFLDILGGVVNLLLQLGGAGAFGSKIQGNINKGVPGYAIGTNFHPGGLAMVGERGPELVSMPRGSKVFTNSQTRGMMGGGVHVTVGVDPQTGNLLAFTDSRIARSIPFAANAGAQLAAANASRMQHRTVRR